MRTEGRGGLSQQLLIERTDGGWISHASGEHVALAEHLHAQEESLTDRQAEGLELVYSSRTLGYLLVGVSPKRPMCPMCLPHTGDREVGHFGQ